LAGEILDFNKAKRQSDPAHGAIDADRPRFRPVEGPRHGRGRRPDRTLPGLHGLHDQLEFRFSLKEIAKDFLGDPIEVERTPGSQRRSSGSRRTRPSSAPSRAPICWSWAPRLRHIAITTPAATSLLPLSASSRMALAKQDVPAVLLHETVDGVTKWVGGRPDLRPLYRLPEIALPRPLS
jgi:hypothetical protein